MKTTSDYIKEAKEALGITSDYALAKWLGVTVQAMSKYKHGERTIDDYTAVRIAEALQIDPMEVIAAANYEREKDEKRRDFWKRKMAAGLAAAVMVFAVISIGYSDIAEAYQQDSVYYVNSRDWHRPCLDPGVFPPRQGPLMDCTGYSFRQLRIWPKTTSRIGLRVDGW